MPAARIYLDNAATSWPKPEEVYRAVDRYQRELGAAVGRGAYGEAVEVDRLVQAARRGVSNLIGAGDPRRIVFTYSGTDSLNLALHGLLADRTADDCHVVTTVVEHNSVLRPLRALEERRRIRVTRVDCDSAGVVDPSGIASACERSTRLVVLTHASNVTGAIQPVAEVGEHCRRRGILLLVDAAQTLGDVPIDVSAMGIDLLAAPGHKGLLGPLGTGVLYLGPGREEQVAGIRLGGTGTLSELDLQPTTMPDKYEAGNLNAPGLVGLDAGVAFVRQRGVEQLSRHVQSLCEQFLTELKQTPGLTIHGPTTAAGRVGVVSVTLSGYDPQELASTLESGWQVQVRAGLHCAPGMHRHLGTLDRGGTVRFSMGPFTTHEDIAVAVTALRELAASTV